MSTEDTDKTIREAAVALAQALTAGGESYLVSFEAIDVTSNGDPELRYAYIAHVQSVNKRTIV